MNDKEKLEAISEILDGLKWYGGEYRYKPKDEETEEGETSKWVNPHDYDRDNIDEMIDEIKKIAVSE